MTDSFSDWTVEEGVPPAHPHKIRQINIGFYNLYVSWKERASEPDLLVQVYHGNSKRFLLRFDAVHWHRIMPELAALCMLDAVSLDWATTIQANIEYPRR